jgi:hypothetical protein
MQNALVVYLQYSLQEIQRLHGELSSRCDGSPQWRSAVTTAEELIKYLRNCIADQNVRRLTVCGVHALTAVGRLEDALRWSIKEAGSRLHRSEFSHRRSWCQHSAHFHINALIALQGSDTELASIWMTASRILDAAVDNKYAIQIPSLLHRSEIPAPSERLRHLTDTNKHASDVASLALRRLEERHLRVKWAYDVVDAVVRLTNGDQVTPSIVNYRTILSEKSKVVSGIAEAYAAAAEYEEKASSAAHAGVAAVWRVASRLMVSSAADLPQGQGRLCHRRGEPLPWDSCHYDAGAVAQVAQALSLFAEGSRSRDLGSAVSPAFPAGLRTRTVSGTRARRLDELVAQINSSVLLVSPRGDMSAERDRLLLLVKTAEEAVQDAETSLIVKEQAEAAASRPGRANAVAASLLRTASEHFAALLEDKVGAVGALRYRLKASELISLACGLCHSADVHFQSAAQARAIGKMEAAEAWAQAGGLLLAAVERTRVRVETQDVIMLSSVLAGHEQEYAAKAYADLALALESTAPNAEEMELLRILCATWKSIIQHVPGSDLRAEAILRIRAQFNAALSDPLKLYADSPGRCEEALLSLASLLEADVDPPDAYAGEALLAERTRLVECVCELASIFDDATTSDVAIDVSLARLLSDCTSLLTTTTQALQAENLTLAAARVTLLATYLKSIRAKLAKNVLQEKVLMESVRVRKAAVDFLATRNWARDQARAELRGQVADALLAQAQALVVPDGASESSALSSSFNPRDEPPDSSSNRGREAGPVDAISSAYFAAASFAASPVSLSQESDEKQRQHVRNANGKLRHLHRELGDVLCELADLTAATTLSAEEHARQLSVRDYEVRALRESVRLYQRILGALQRGQNNLAMHWKQAAIIKELPEVRAEPPPTTSPPRKIPAPGLIEDVLAAGAAYYESAALALEAGDEARASVLLFAAKQTMESTTFLRVDQTTIPEENAARVQANLRILSSVAGLADAVGAGMSGAEACFQVARQEFAALRQAGTAVWSAELAERYEALHRMLLAEPEHCS